MHREINLHCKNRSKIMTGTAAFILIMELVFCLYGIFMWKQAQSDLKGAIEQNTVIIRNVDQTLNELSLKLLAAEEGRREFEGLITSIADSQEAALEKGPSLREHELAKADSYTGVSALYYILKKYDKAISAQSKGVNILSRYLDKTDGNIVQRKIAEAYYNAGFVLVRQGKAADAMEYYEKAMELRRAIVKEERGTAAKWELAKCCENIAEDIDSNDMESVLPIYSEGLSACIDAYKESKEGSRQITD
jgi:tetratricopeptide (TPR) repeat protein